VGLVIAFAFMGIFILTMIALQALFPSKKAEPAMTEKAAPAVLVEAPAAVGPAAVEEEDDLSVVAAAAVAIASLRSLNQSKLGEALSTGRGTWWIANQLSARQDSHPKK